MSLILHNFFRSSTSYRVRAALNFKGLNYEYVAYALRKGETRSPDYLALNPQGLVPTLEVDGQALTQSLAILEWLEETHPSPPLLPSHPLDRARVRALAHTIALDIHPLNNLRVLFQIRDVFGADEAAQADWFRHWVAEGFLALETRLARDVQTGAFCHGDAPTLADLCLVAQCLNNRRFDVDMRPYPTIARIHAACMELAPFASAAPEHQPDFATP